MAAALERRALPRRASARTRSSSTPGRDPENPWRLPRPQAAVVVGLGDEGGADARPSCADSVRQRGAGLGASAWPRSAAAAPAAVELAATLLGSGGLGVIASAVGPRDRARRARGQSDCSADIGWPRGEPAHAGGAVPRPRHRGLARPAGAGRGQPRGATSSRPRIAVRHRRRCGASSTAATAAPTTTSSPPSRAARAAASSSRWTRRRARTEVRAQPTQVELVRELVASAPPRTRNDDPTIGRTLFQLLVPAEIEPFLGGTDRMVLELDARTAAIPWELLDAGVAAQRRRPRGPGRCAPSCCASCASRASAPQPQRRRTPRTHVLVIGEPLLDPSAPYAPLPAAREEALARAARCSPAPAACRLERVLALAERARRAPPWSARCWRGAGASCTSPAMANRRSDGGRGVVLSERPLPRAAPRSRRCAPVPELGVRQLLPPRRRRRRRSVLRGCRPGAVFAAGVADAADRDRRALRRGLRAGRWRTGRRRSSRAASTASCSPARASSTPWPLRARPAGGRRRSGKTWAAYQCYGDPELDVPRRRRRRPGVPGRSGRRVRGDRLAAGRWRWRWRRWPIQSRYHGQEEPTSS
ncbi:MAG: hypothetical protein MZW92_66215 [Comamonadaceae bacterium]|nr:hypothetical protein [Comamonadaceae bacterium]